MVGLPLDGFPSADPVEEKEEYKMVKHNSSTTETVTYIWLFLSINSTNLE